MELRDVEGVRFLTLSPFTYQFAQASGNSFDDNWLVINGKARSDVEQWKFQDPCLLVGEAQDIGVWLRSVADGQAAPMIRDEQGGLEPTIRNIEPNIGFGLVGYEPDLTTIRAFLWLESSPPSAGGGMEWFMDLAIKPDDLRAAASQWEAELARFPQR